MPWGASIFAKSYSTNIVGDSATSSEGNGAVILTYPDAPLNLANDPLVTSSIRLGLDSDQGSSNGGTAILDYRISYKAAGALDSDYSVLSSTTTSTSYETDGLVSGNSYDFKVEARNEYGYSQSSSNEVTVLQA